MYKLQLLLNKNQDIFDSIIEKNICENLNIYKLDANNYIINSNSEEITVLKISEILTEFIIVNYESEILKKIILTDYSYFSNHEREFIYEKALKIMNNDKSDLIKTLITLKRRFHIKQCIFNFLQDNSYIDITGLIQFRLIEYKKILSELVEKIVLELKTQNEYREFIEMLKFFVDTQKNRVSKLHIIFENDGKYTILNEYNKNITSDCFKDFLDDAKEHSLSNEDLLISSLITLAPKKIIIHLTHSNYNKNILKTIEQIFTNKVVINESVPCLELVTQK